MSKENEVKCEYLDDALRIAEALVKNFYSVKIIPIKDDRSYYDKVNYYKIEYGDCKKEF